MSAAETNASPAQDVRPIVPVGAQGNWGVWVFGAILLLGGYMIFSALSAADDAAQVPSVLAPQDGGSSRISSPPPLRTPERFLEPRPQAQSAPQPEPRIVPPFVPTVLPPVAPFQPALPLPEPVPVETQIPSEPTGPEIVFEASAVPAAPVTAEAGSGEQERVLADRLRNPSRTIPQGTVIPAVLETALDSTRAGGVRALVQRDVSSFDGTRILIPRGSRLYGEYEARLQSGQNRAMVQWTRLIRPDGVTIALDSPSSDPLGRAGVRGRVDSKFFQRFGGAILQSVLDIGVGLAVNEVDDGVLVALPGSTQNVQIQQPQSIQPTLKVKHGTSVSVFVARDLDFSSVDP